MNTIGVDPIPNGTKFVAIYGNIGAALFMVDEFGQLKDSEGDAITNAPDQWLLDVGYTYWLPLPSSFKLWFEQ